MESRPGSLEYAALRVKAIPGRPPWVEGERLRQLYKAITTKNPLQYRFEFALWTQAMVRELIRERFGVRLSDISVGRLLRKMGLTPQKPLRRAYEQDPELVESWLVEDYPRIRERYIRYAAIRTLSMGLFEVLGAAKALVKFARTGAEPIRPRLRRRGRDLRRGLRRVRAVRQ